MAVARPRMALFLCLALVIAPAATAQSGGFVATLGADTVQIETFRRSGNKVEGTVITRSPVTRVMRYTMTFGPDERPIRYEMETKAPDGTPFRTNGMAGSMTFMADSLVRESLQDGAMATTRMATPIGAYPSPGLPYLGVSYLMYQYALADARRRTAPDSQAYVSLLTMGNFQKAPQRPRAWFVGTDSAEIDYFGQARHGYKFDAAGQLIRADWTGTTYRYKIVRVPAFNAETFAMAWDKLDKSGKGLGAISPRDTVRATIGAAQLSIEYSRPSKRGRKVWGEVVPWERVWRLGADFATHFTTSADLTIGGVDIPAGTYTLWMFPSAAGESQLVVNKRTQIFGTMYSRATDLVRIPLVRGAEATPVERFTLDLAGGMLSIRWDDAVYQVPVKVK
ncbi:MAG: DUF2911 domain-containing protein [Gemmatimonadales bacterium]|nr:DUF2911 domain-containing protein [Gemmatimonadales bacterium]